MKPFCFAARNCANRASMRFIGGGECQVERRESRVEGQTHPSLFLHPIANQLLWRADVEAAIREDGADEIGEVARGFPEVVRLHFAENVASVRLGGNEPEPLVTAHEKQAIGFDDRHASFVAGIFPANFTRGELHAREVELGIARGLFALAFDVSEKAIQETIAVTELMNGGEQS